MEGTSYMIYKIGDFFICNLIDKRIRAFTQIFQSVGRTKHQAVKKMNRMLRPLGFKAEKEVPYATYHL